jgi:hypothetical protein
MSLGLMKPVWRLKAERPGVWAYLTQAGPLLVIGFVAAALIARNT